MTVNGNSLESSSDRLDRPIDILIVDDSATARSFLRSCLADRYRCSEAESFTDAITKLRETDFAVVVTDVIMPGLSGIELLRRVKDEFGTTEVIIASGVDR